MSITPINQVDLQARIDELQSSKILNQYNGNPTAISSLAALLNAIAPSTSTSGPGEITSGDVLAAIDGSLDIESIKTLLSLIEDKINLSTIEASLASLVTASTKRYTGTIFQDANDVYYLNRYDQNAGTFSNINLATGLVYTPVGSIKIPNSGDSHLVSQKCYQVINQSNPTPFYEPGEELTKITSMVAGNTVVVWVNDSRGIEIPMVSAPSVFDVQPIEDLQIELLQAIESLIINGFDIAKSTTVPGTAPTTARLLAGIFNTTLPTATNGQSVALQTDANGRLIVAGTLSGGIVPGTAANNLAKAVLQAISSSDSLIGTVVGRVDSITALVGAANQYVRTIGTRFGSLYVRNEEKDKPLYSCQATIPSSTANQIVAAVTCGVGRRLTVKLIRIVPLSFGNYSTNVVIETGGAMIGTTGTPATPRLMNAKTGGTAPTFNSYAPGAVLITPGTVVTGVLSSSVNNNIHSIFHYDDSLGEIVLTAGNSVTVKPSTAIPNAYNVIFFVTDEPA